MTKINETVTVKILPTTLIRLNLKELKIILERRLNTIENITDPDFLEMRYPDTKIKFYKKHYENVQSIGDVLYAMQNVLEDYIKEGTKELEKQKAEQALKANAE